MSETWLTPDEVEQFTGKKRWKAQSRALATMGVPFKPNGVGRPLVERASVLTGAGPSKKPSKPNWNAMNGQAA